MDSSSQRRHLATSTRRKSDLSSEFRSVRAGDESSLIATRKSKVMTSVRRSLSVTPRKSRAEHKVLSTMQERTYTFSGLRRDDPSLSPPTIEQIAMGLHLSRTPHLRGSTHTPPGAFPRSTSLTLPPPPTRSAMKKSHVSANPTPSASSTTVTSLSTPYSSNSLTLSFKSRMSRLLVGSKPSLAATSPRPSVSDVDVPPSPKKAVRFSVDAELCSNAFDDE